MLYKLDSGTRNLNGDSINVDWVSPQDYHVDAPYSYRHCVQGEELPDGIRLPDMKKVRGALLSDHLRMGGVGSFMVVSERLISSLVTMRFPEIKSIPMNVYNGKQKLRYYGIHFETKLTQELINWEESEFGKCEGYYGEFVEGGIQIASYSEYLSSLRSVSQDSGRKLKLRAKNIVINDISDKYDLFYSATPYMGLFCSERFLELIINNEFTGFTVQRVI